MSCCIERTDGVDGDDTTLQQAYDNSAGAVPSIQLSAAFGAVTLRGDPGVANILELEDDAGNDEFVFTRTGNLSALAASVVVALGDASGSPSQDFVKDGAGTSEIRFRQALGADTLNDKQIVHASNENFEILHFDGAAFDTLLRITATNVVVPQSRLFVGDVASALTLLELTKDDAGTTNIRFNNETFIRFEIQLSATEDALFQTFDGAGVLLFTTTYFNASGNWVMPATLALSSASPFLVIGDSSGSPVQQFLKTAAGTSMLEFHAGAIRRADITHDASEDLLIRHRDAVGLVTNTTTYANATGLWTYDASATYDSASPVLTLGNDGGSPVVTFRKTAAGTVEIRYMAANVRRADVLFNGAEDYVIRHRDGAGAIQFTTTYINASGQWIFPAEVEIDGTLDHDGASLGFRGVAPIVVPAAYTVTNHNTDKVYDADATTVDELADVLGSVIEDLIDQGLLGGSVT
jgi:hypothetical protein